MAPKKTTIIFHLRETGQRALQLIKKKRHTRTTKAYVQFCQNSQALISICRAKKGRAISLGSALFIKADPI